MIPQPAAAGHVTVYVQPYGVDLQVQGVMVAGEEGGVDIRGLKDDVQPEGVAAVLMDKDRQILALSSNFVAGADGVARGSLDCSTTEIGEIFADLDGMAVREFSLALWDATGGHLVGVGLAQMRNNPLLPDVYESWTNVTVLASNEWRIAVAGLQAGIDANAAAIAALQGASSTNAAGIVGMWAAVATNAAGIEALRGATGTNAAAIAALQGAVATNATGIVSNALGIASNATGIASNAADIAVLSSAVGELGNATNWLRGAIGTNADGIASLWAAMEMTSNAIPTVPDYSARWASNDEAHARFQAATQSLRSATATNAAGIAALWLALQMTSNAIPAVVDWSARWTSNDTEHAKFRSATNWLRNSMSNNTVRIGALQTNLSLTSNVFSRVWDAIASNRTEANNAFYEVWQGIYAASNAIPSTNSLASHDWVEDYVAANHQSLVGYATESYVSDMLYSMELLLMTLTATNGEASVSNLVVLSESIAEAKGAATNALAGVSNNAAAITLLNAATNDLAGRVEDLEANAEDVATDLGVLQGATNVLNTGVSSNSAAIAALAQQVEDIEIGELGFEKYVVNAGGWHYPDYFTWTALPGRWGTNWSGEVSVETNNSIVVGTYTNTAIRGWVLDSTVYRQQDFTNTVTWETDEAIVALSEEAGTWYVDFTDDFDPAEDDGESVTFSGHLGGYTAYGELFAPNVQTSEHIEYRADAPGSLLASAWECVVGEADDAPDGAELKTWVGARTNLESLAWNGSDWLCSDCLNGWPVSLRADYNGTWTGYRPLTLVTPRHAVAAKHFCPPNGSTNWWLSGNSTTLSGVVETGIDLRSDLRLVRLVEPVAREPALVMPDQWAGYFFGRDGGGVSGVPGVPVVSLNATEQARVAFWTPSPLVNGQRRNDSDYSIFGTDGTWTDGRFDAPNPPGVGGDSGSPAFLLVKDDEDAVRQVLLGCFWHGCDGPLPTAGELNRAIEETWGDTNRVEAADFGAWGYPNYLEGDLTPW